MEEKKTMGATEGEVRQEENNVMENVTETDESVNSQTDAKKQTACSKWGRACSKTVKFFCRHYCKIIGVAALLVMIAFAVMWLMRFAVDIRESFGDLFDIADKSDFDAERISDNLVYYDHYGYDNKGYVCDNNGRKLIRHIMWIKKAEGDEAKTAPVCYYNGKFYGYFHPQTGRVIVKPVWEKAWEFSEGLAAVNDKGYIKFIDTTGKVLFSREFPVPVMSSGPCSITQDLLGTGLILIGTKGYLVMLDCDGNVKESDELAGMGYGQVFLCTPTASSNPNEYNLFIAQNGYVHQT